MNWTLQSLGRVPRRSLIGSLVGGVVFVVVVLSLAACGGSATTSSGSANGSQGAGGVQVVIQGFAFQPGSVTAKVGETVTWTNKDSVDHDIVSDDGTFRSNALGNGDVFEFTFQKAGRYAYHCGIHPNMTGTVVVE